MNRSLIASPSALSIAHEVLADERWDWGRGIRRRQNSPESSSRANLAGRIHSSGSFRDRG